MRVITSSVSFLVFFLFQVTLLFSAAKLSNSNDTIILNNLKVIESAIELGKYIDTKDDFTVYDNSFLNRSKQLKETMFTFKSDFIIDKNLNNTDISLVIGPADYPYTIYLRAPLKT